MKTLLRLTYFSASGVSLFAGLMVMASMLIAERAPQSARFWIITIVVSVSFAGAGLLLLAIGRHLVAIGVLVESKTNDGDTVLERRWRRLAGHMLAGGLVVLCLLLLVTYAILARIDEGFAVFG